MQQQELRLNFGAPRHNDRMLALQLGEIRPVGIELAFELAPTLSQADAATGLDVAELPLAAILDGSGERRGFLALPIFPARDDGAGEQLPPRSVIALRREISESAPWAGPALVDAFEAAREAAYRRLKLVTSPALADPWLADEIAADERRYGGDPFPVGYAANLGALELAASSLGGGSSADLSGHFVPATVHHRPVARAEDVEGTTEPAAEAGIRCRGLRYVDRTLPLEIGVATTGAELRYEATATLGGSLQAVLSGEVDLAEVLLGDLVAELAQRSDRLVGLPIFPSRRFTQRSLWTSVDSPLSSLEQLRGGRIGFPAGAATGAAWARALLDDAGIAAEFESHPIGGRLGRILDRGAAGETLQARLRAGELDALVTPYAIPAEDGGDDLRQLLTAPAEAERAQAKLQGPAPISNVLAMNRTAYERDPSSVRDLLAAYARARAKGRESLLAEIPSVGLPELGKRTRAAEELFGGDPYPHGVEPNRVALRVFTRNLAALGVAQRELGVEEMFPPQALDIRIEE